ncbi:F-box only protein 2-like isoform X3 [Centropristis striata]|uniref:F-box only protein 2-like isoform X2 n=1 Tax=Centropristis striata TaxID=184440 RepID=UPI0027DF40E3|nr:F-box only protein 2-like isoform X2 [Centropristis striata]XP_059188565.1 F-box only protein 2-like isoform X3 [Centropristis striata]
MAAPALRARAAGSAGARIKPEVYKTTDGKVIVEDELLHFISVKMRTVPHDEIVLLAANNFSSDWIEESKRLLFELCPTTQRCVEHKGAQKDANNIKDCMRLLDERGEDIPRFVSYHLDELPPVGFGSMDASALLSRLERLSQEVSTLREALETQASVSINQGAATAALDRRMTDLERSHRHGSPGRARGAGVASSGSQESEVLGSAEHARRPSGVTASNIPVIKTKLLFPVNLEVLEEIFLHLPPHQVVVVCRLVCHQWKEVADSESLWKERCRREGYRIRDASKIPRDWRMFYFLCKKRRNLLKNPRGEHEMKNWQILKNGGDNWKVEGVLVAHPNKIVKKNFVTSYGMCRKGQLIDLEVEGYNASFMDHFQPDIKISDWYAPRWECGSEYEICVELLNQRKKPIQTFSPETIYFEQFEEHLKHDQKWNQMTHVFKNYGPGVRYIRFVHGGKDTIFWAGWYGIRVTDSSVEICPAMDT